jgi:hypothetical protein
MIATMILASLVGVVLGLYFVQFCGYGTIRFVWYPKVAMLSGHMQMGKLHGNGQQLNIDGTSLIGKWNMGKLEMGQKTFDDGTIYLGEFANGVPHGIGKMQFPNGSSYTTTWEDGIKRGGGVYRDVNGWGYVGVFDDNQFVWNSVLMLPEGFEFVFLNSSSL